MTAPSFDPLGWLDDALASLDAAGLRRRPANAHRSARANDPHSGIWRADSAAAELVNFGSNDYLSLAADPRLGAAAAKAARREGWGAGASPLVVGHSEAHERLEGRLAEFFGAEGALVFPSGFAANSGAVAALVGRGDIVLADERNHRQSDRRLPVVAGGSGVYPHGDIAALAGMLEQSAGLHRRLVVTDTLFSMDGDVAPLGELAELAERHRAMLMIDEARTRSACSASAAGAWRSKWELRTASPFASVR